MQSLLRFSRRIDALSAHISVLATACVLLACAISAGNAISRYAFDLSSNAWLEAQWYLFAGIVMLGAAHTLRRNGHVRVDLVYGNVSSRTRAWIDVLGTLLFLFPAIGLLTWFSWPMFMSSFLSGEVSSNFGGLVRWPVKLLLPVGFGLLWLQGVSELIKRIAQLRGVDVVGVDQYERPQQ